MAEALTIVLLVLALLGIAMALRQRLDLPLEAVVLTAVALVVLVLYLCAVLGMLKGAPSVILVGGLWLGIVAVRRGSWRTELAALCSPGMIAFYLVLAYSWVRLLGEHYFYWDELSTWGLASKSMYLSNALPRADGSVELTDYPPGGALFHYFVSYFVGFSEGKTYFAHAVMVCAALLVPFQRLRWRQLPALLATGVIVYLITFIFAAGPASIYADLVIASWWGASIGCLLVNRWSMRALLACGPPLAALPIFKDIGWWLALLAVAVAASAYVCSRLMSGAESQPESPARPGRRRWLSVALGAAPVAAVLLAGPLVTRASWRHYVETHYSTRTLQLSVSLGQVLRSFSPETATPRDVTTITRFRDALWNEEVSGIVRFPLVEAMWERHQRGYLRDVKVRPPRSTVFWFVVLVALGTAAAFLQPERSATFQVATVVFVLAVGCMAYLFGHLLSYLYAFGEWEGSRLGSFGRYVGLFDFGWSLAILTAVVHAAKSTGRRGVLASALLGALVLGGVWLAPYESGVFLIDGPRPLAVERSQLSEPLARLKRAVRPGDTVHVIFQGTPGMEHRVVRFELAPAVVNRWCWSVGAPYVAGDPWTCPMTVTELSEAFAKSTHVFLGKTDQQFWEKYGSLFPNAPTTDSVFRVNVSRQGQIRLEPID